VIKAGSDPELNIVSFDVPYPPDYGGAIDIYYKLETLNDLGIKIYFHCFQYGRNGSKRLEEICVDTFYYPRKRNLIHLFSQKPYIVETRFSSELLENLLKNDAPILFEGLHSTYWIESPKLKDRMKILRAHNIEHDYYNELSKVELNRLKKWYLKLECWKLKAYEKKICNFNLISAISETDSTYFASKHENVVYTPIFHGFTENYTKNLEEYALYHGNLGVPENENAACFLINEVFSNLNFPFIIAGKNPNRRIRNLIGRYSNISLIDSPSIEKLERLISQAKIHVLPTFQSTGMKLKLIHVLFTKGTVIINSNMITDSELKNCCIIADTAEEMKNSVVKSFTESVKYEVLELRKNLLNKKFSNEENARELIKKIFD
jgi:hypothetical protein